MKRLNNVRAGVGRRRRVVSAGVVVALALVASACGGDDDSSSTTGAVATTEGAAAVTTDGAPDATTAGSATTESSDGSAASDTTAPSSTEADSPSACRAESLVFAVSAASTTLDPATLNQASSTFIQPAYEPLIRRNPAGDYVPGLAVEWGYVGEGNTEFAMTLREGVTFSDGSELTAEGVKAHFEYMQTSPVNGQLLTGATFEVTGPLDLTIELASPNPLLEELLTQDWVIGMVISPTALAAPEQLATSTAGAGQYVLDTDATLSGDTYVYRANPNYYDPSQIHFDTMTVRVITNPNSILNALQSGEVDAALGDFTTAEGARSAGLQVVAQPTVWQGLGLLDRAGTLSAPLGDQRVRQAINYAIDREAITDALYAGDGIASSEIALPGSEDFNEETADMYPYDPDKARALLAEAGYPDGFTLKAISTGFANIGLAGQAIAAQLAEVGITLELDEREINGYVTGVFGAEAPAAVLGLGSPPLFISATVALMPTSPFNPFKTEDAELMDLYQQAAAAAPDERAAIDQQIVARVQELAWFAPVTYTPVYVYGAPELGGIEMNERNRLQNPVEIFSTEC
jgi:peptide/nickel transport system substrate-binding protein